MNFPWSKTRRDFRDVFVNSLHAEADGSFVVITQALNNVAARNGLSEDLDVNEVIREIQKVKKPAIKSTVDQLG